MYIHPIRKGCGDSFSLETKCSFFSVQVYLAAGAVYGLEGALGDLEQCARGIQSGTSDTELAFLEDQVATAAAQVQQSELQVLEDLSLFSAAVLFFSCIRLCF